MSRRAVVVALVFVLGSACGWMLRGRPVPPPAAGVVEVLRPVAPHPSEPGGWQWEETRLEALRTPTEPGAKVWHVTLPDGRRFTGEEVTVPRP